MKSRSSLLAPSHPGGPGKRAVKWLWWWCGVVWYFVSVFKILFGLRICMSIKIHLKSILPSTERSWYSISRRCGDIAEIDLG